MEGKGQQTLRNSKMYRSFGSMNCKLAARTGKGKQNVKLDFAAIWDSNCGSKHKMAERERKRNQTTSNLLRAKVEIAAETAVIGLTVSSSHFPGSPFLALGYPFFCSLCDLPFLLGCFLRFPRVFRSRRREEHESFFWPSLPCFTHAWNGTISLLGAFWESEKAIFGPEEDKWWFPPQTQLKCL